MTTSLIGFLLKQNEGMRKLIEEYKSGKVKKDEPVQNEGSAAPRKKSFTQITQAYPLGYIWSMLFWKYISYWLLLRRPGLTIVSELSGPRMPFHIGTLAEFAVYFYAVGLDPGYLPMNRPSDIENKSPGEDANNPAFCAHCNRLQPPRSKHCYECDRCVQKFDHHCPILYSCVGLNNHAAFVSLCVGITVWAFAYTGYCHEKFFGSDPVQQPLFPTILFNWRAIYSFQQYPLLVTLYMHSWLHIVWMTPLCVGHVVFMFVNGTTYEVLKRKKVDDTSVSDQSEVTCRALDGNSYGMPYLCSGNPIINFLNECILSFAPRNSSIFHRTVQSYVISVEQSEK